MTKEFFLCVDGLLVKAGKILLLKRSVEPFKGYWHVAGGHVEGEETARQALVREFKEETGLDVEVGEMVTVRAEETFDRIKIIVAFKIISAVGEIRLNFESDKYGWFASFPTNCVFDYSRFV